jgi:hypothetical protein
VATFALPRFIETHIERQQHARKLEQVARETGANISTKQHSFDASDTRTLRGIPAIGRGVAGVIIGTQPESVVTSKTRHADPRSA